MLPARTTGQRAVEVANHDLHYFWWAICSWWANRWMSRIGLMSGKQFQMSPPKLPDLDNERAQTNQGLCEITTQEISKVLARIKKSGKLGFGKSKVRPFHHTISSMILDTCQFVAAFSTSKSLASRHEIHTHQSLLRVSSL